MKRYRIVETNRQYKKFRVDKKHFFLFLPYWDNGAEDLSPYYFFDTIEDAEKAILEQIIQYDIMLTNNKNKTK